MWYTVVMKKNTSFHIRFTQLDWDNVEWIRENFCKDLPPMTDASAVRVALHFTVRKCKEQQEELRRKAEW